MSDDLVERLHDCPYGSLNTDKLLVEAADRIEELERILSSSPCEMAAHSNRLTEYMFHWEGRALDAEAKLAKAVEALEQIASHRKKCHEYDDDVGHERREFDVEDMIIMEYAARTTLAELKGDK